MSDDTPKGRGRPRFEPTPKERRQVRKLVGLGLTHEDISGVIGISEKTLRRHFRKELETGVAIANARVAASLFRQATSKIKPNPTCAIFWMKARAGWRDQDPKEPEIGKKAQTQQAAHKARNRFKPSAPPKLEVVR